MNNTNLSPARILVVDDQADVLQAARLLLRDHFTSVQTLHDPERLPELAMEDAFDILLLDMNFGRGSDSGAEGLEWLKRVLDANPEAVVVFVTAHGDVDLAVRAIKEGAADFVVKPWENERLVATLLAASKLSSARAETARLRTRQRRVFAADRAEAPIVGASPAMQNVLAQVRKAAPTDANVLILGENGTGKELVAREIHRQSARSGEVFLRVDLGTISAALFESEIFGHRRGAFTDAKEERIGFFRAAAGGTLFLDEIGNVPLHLQVKLLTALERREVVPLGCDRAEAIDVRLICATNLPLGRLKDQDVFRPDLLFRINTIEITLPPLRERREDIPVLLEHFAEFYSRKYNVPRKRIAKDALNALAAYDWPGNIRALRHAVERAIIMDDATVLGVHSFPFARNNRDRISTPSSERSGSDLKSIERDAIRGALHQHGTNISRAAKSLGLTRASLYRRMQKYDL